jgi:hypothetical protein
VLVRGENEGSHRVILAEVHHGVNVLPVIVNKMAPKATLSEIRAPYVVSRRHITKIGAYGAEYGVNVVPIMPRGLA